MLIAQAETSVAHWHESQQSKSPAQAEIVRSLMQAGRDYTISEMQKLLLARGHQFALPSGTISRVFRELVVTNKVTDIAERKCSVTGVTCKARRLFVPQQETLF